MTEAQELRLSAALVAVLCLAMLATLAAGYVRGIAAGPNPPPRTVTLCTDGAEHGACAP